MTTRLPASSSSWRFCRKRCAGRVALGCTTKEVGRRHPLVVTIIAEQSGRRESPMIPSRASARRLLKARLRWHSCIPLFEFDLAETVAAVRERAFQGRHGDVAWMIADDRPLACIMPTRLLMCFHALLNHSGIPRFVMEHIITHELIHLDVPPAEEAEGKRVIHPPAFWQREADLSPRREEAMEWIWRCWRDCLRRSEKQQGILVKRNWPEWYGVTTPSQATERIIAKYDL